MSQRAQAPAQGQSSDKQHEPGSEHQGQNALANGQAGDAAARRMAKTSSFQPGHDPLGQKEKLLEPFYRDMEEVSQTLAPQFKPLGLNFRPEIILATAMQEAADVNPATNRSFDNGLGIMQLTPYQGQMDENIARVIGWDNSASIEYNVAHSRWRDAKTNILGGGLELLNKAHSVAGGVPKTWSEMDEKHRWRAVLFAYNAGQGAAINALRNGGPDARMISRFMYNGSWHEHDYTAEFQSKMDYVDEHDPFAGGGVQTGGHEGGTQGGGTQGGGTHGGGKHGGGKHGGGKHGGDHGVPQQDLRRGMVGPAVKELQDDLVKLHYLTEEELQSGPGIFGPHTEHALKAFQHDHHIPETGFFGPASRAALTSALSTGKKKPEQKPEQGQGKPGDHQQPGGGQGQQGQGQNNHHPDVPAGDLSVGSHGPQVTVLQKDLVKLQYLSEADMQTGPGTFGPHTQAALIAFQQAYGIAPTGRYDAATRLELQQALDGKKPKHQPGAGGAEPPGAEAAIGFALHPGVNDLNPGGAFGGWHYWCLHLVNKAYATSGHPGKHLAMPTAAASHNAYASDGAVHRVGTPPRGALVFFSWYNKSAGEEQGHIGISLGNGEYVGTAYDGINSATMTRPVGEYAGGSYLGWAMP